MADDLTLRVASKELYSELNAEYLRAQSGFDLWFKAINSSQTNDRIRNALTTAGSALGKVGPDGVTTQRMLAHEITFDQWRSAAVAVRSVISGVLEEEDRSGNWSSRFWNEVVEQSKSDIKNEVLAPTASLLPWVAAALIALALVYIVFAIRGAFA